MGPNPVQPSEVEAWCRLTGYRLSPWEVETLFAMDRAFLSRVNKPRKESETTSASAVMATLGPARKGGKLKPDGHNHKPNHR